MGAGELMAVHDGVGAFNIDAGEWVRALQVWVHDGVEQWRQVVLPRSQHRWQGESDTATQ